MKRPLLYLVGTLCAVSVVQADQAIRSLQQTLKDQGFYYGAVTGDKSAETTAAIRRYQIRNGLQVTGELNDETFRSVNSSSNSVAGASKTNSKSAISQPKSGGPDVNTHMSQSLPVLSFNPPDRQLQTNPSYSASVYQSTPFRVDRRSIAAAQYRLMSHGYYRGSVDGKYGRRMTFALRAFQSSTGLPATGRLDTRTIGALQISDADLAYEAREAPASRGYETWMPVRKFKHGQWIMKWKKQQRNWDSIAGDEDQRTNAVYSALDY